MKTYSLFIFLIIIFRVGAQDFIGIPPDCATNPPDFGKLTYEQANAAVKSQEDLILGRKALKICPEYIENLVYQLRHEPMTSDNMTLAIYFLGSFKLCT